VKINKIYFLVFIAAVISIGLLASNFIHFKNLETDTAPSKTEKVTKPSATNQLLKPSPTRSADRQDQEAMNVGDPDDLQTMEGALNDFYSSEDEQDRESAMMILGEYPFPKAKEAILYALNDPEESVREQAVSQISAWENEKDRREMLLTALNNDKPEIVVLALESITEYDDPALMEKIKELSNDKSEEVSESAKNALEIADLK
jgi:hypothetical protein